MFPICSLPGSCIDVTHRVYGAPTVDDFGETSESYSDVTIEATWHHTTDRARLERLREAGHQRSLVNVYTTSPVNTVTSTRPDRLLIAGVWYEVVEQADYTHMGGPFLLVGERLR